MAHRQLRGHGLLGSELIFAAERHVDGRRADGGVETLRKTLLAADLQTGQVLAEGFSLALALEAVRHEGAVILLRIDGGNDDLRILGDAVGIQEGTGDADDTVAAPRHVETGLRLDDGHDGRVEVLTVGGGAERLHALRSEDDGHALLALGDRKLRSVKALILLRDLVEIDIKAGGQLADRDADASRAEVVAALDQSGNGRVAEQALKLALGGRVALLHLRAADLDGLLRMSLRGAGRAADAVAARRAAEQNDHVARGGLHAHDVRLRGRADDSADLQALRNVAGIVELRDLAGGKADLVAVGAVAVGRAGRNLAARKLAVQRLLHRDARIAGAGHAHRLIHIRAAGERIADCAAQAGGRSAERLDLRRMIVGFVLELDKPVLRLAVDGNRHLDRARVDLIALVKVGHKAAAL